MAEFIIPISFSRALTNEELECFLDELKMFAETAKVGCQIIPAELANERAQAEFKTGENNALLPDVSFAKRKVCLEKTKTCSYVDKEGKCDLAEGFCENRQT